MKRTHGRHNKKVCDILFLKEEYQCNDWVATTSFYSAIHFIDHALFPCTYNGSKFDNINQAHLSIRRNSKHRTREFLLNKLMPQFKSEYNFLLTNSQTARYSNYNIHEAIANKAVRNLDSIIKAYDCNKNEIRSVKKGN